MKKSITLAALLLALGTSVFAVAAPVRSLHNNAKDEIAFVPLKTENGFGVQINKLTTGKAIVMVYNADKNVIFKDILSKNASGQKGYLISELEAGDYTVEVVSNGQSVKKELHVYEEGNGKSYFFYQ